jgi:DNA polymerase V
MIYMETENIFKLPIFATRISAGFPSPADDYMEGKLDLNKYLIKHPAASFFIRVIGDSMINAGIFDGDLLIVDRSLEALSGKIVIAVIDGDLTVKRLLKKQDKIFLAAENPNYSDIEIKDESSLHIWGVVTNVIHKL